MEQTTPLHYYQQQISTGELCADADQERVVFALDELYQKLLAPIPWLVKIGLKNHKAPKGLYLWGSVGTGKTYLMDNFFHCLPFDDKLRMHFHAFMQVVHSELNEHEGRADPLEFVAKEFAQKTRVLCLDELIVNDITDAMLLATLFEGLYYEGVCILFTSNIPPDRLYEKGLQRQRFLPAIELIKQHSNVIELSTHVDYRQQYRNHEFNYKYGDTQQTHAELERRFNNLSAGQSVTETAITIHGRDIPVIKRSKSVIWFDFEVICGVPRSQKDYLTLCTLFPTIIVSGLRPITLDENNLIRSFINLIDVLYDLKILLIIGANKPIQKIYTRGRFLFPFARTQSRITEMQAENWHL